MTKANSRFDSVSSWWDLGLLGIGTSLDRRTLLLVCIQVFGHGVQRWRLSALDDQPQHERYLPEDGGLSVGIHLVLNLRQQYARKAQDHPGEAGEGEPDAQEPRQESRPVHKRREGQEPQTPKYFGDNKSVKMQIEEQHRQSLPLRLFEYGEEISPAHEDEGSHGVQLI